MGTNGFQYRDWVPVFYPGSLDPCLWLQHYSGQFSCCELALTYHRIPEPTTIQELIDETRGAVQFVFRAPYRLIEEHSEREELARRFAAALWPLKDAGQLAGALAQFPAGFGFIRDNFEKLRLLRDCLEGIPLIAEFECPDWLTPKAAKHLSRERIALACVDGGTSPGDKAFFYATADLAYIRFQGRKHSRWIKGDGSAQHDYLYSRGELAAVLPEIRRLEEECGRVLVFMNNNWRGQATINARMLQELIKD